MMARLPALCAGLMVLCMAAGVRCVSRSDFFLYGELADDQILPTGTDETQSVVLDSSVYFFDEQFSKVYVNTNGFVSVAEPPAQSEYLGKMPASFGMIAAFLGDLDTTDGIGKVYFRQDTSSDVLQKVAEQISQAFPDEAKVTLSHVFIATWDNVAIQAAPERGDGYLKRRNSFQLVLASTAQTTYAVLLYPKDGMEYFSTYLEGQSKPVHAGFNQGLVSGWFLDTNGIYHRIPTDSENSAEDLPELTNSGTQGVWVYKIGSSSFRNVIPGQVARPSTEAHTVFSTYEPETPEPTPAELVFTEQTSAEGQFPKSGLQGLTTQHQSNDRRLTVDTDLHPRGPRPANPGHHQVVVLDDPDEELNVNVFSYYETCSSNRHKCSSSAECRDYSTGYCCHCRPGFYGNGKDCVAEGKPQRMNGKVNGRIHVGSSASPVEFSNNDLHSYVVVNDGRAYVAISSIPPSVGHSLQPLASLGGVIGWAFALEQPEYQNGFSIIGGVFTRQAEVTFQPGGEKLTITQEFKGIDEHDHLVVSTQLDGRIPEVPPGASVQIEPYVEIYQYASNLITSSSTREYTVSFSDGTVRSQTYLWRQKITFQSCPHDETIHAIPPSQQLSVDQVFVMYDSPNQLIRYAMTNKIGPISGPPQQNPCFTGRHGCDTNAVCRPGQGAEFSCECAAGFTGNGQMCDDIDECRETPRICGSHAICNNQPGTFRCECIEGFQFAADGRTCMQVHHNINHCQIGSHECDIPERARCRYTGGSSYECSCNQGFEGNGQVCRDIDECQNPQCHVEAVCVNTPGSFACQCRSGFYGDGFSCTRESVREKTACELEREKATSTLGYIFLQRPTVGQYIPKCDRNGDYDPTQCHDSTGQCWCVDRNGQEISGTRTGHGSRPLCLDHNAVPLPFGPTTSPHVSPMAPGTNLLFAQNGKIEHIPLDGNDMKKEEAKTVLHLPDRVVIAVAYDCVDKVVYWTDITQPSISRASMQGGQPTAIITTEVVSPEGIAIDHLSRNMYWTDSVLDRIEVSKLDGQHRRKLFDTDLVNPRAIIADPVHGRLYWADWNRDSPKIEMSNMDGTDRTVLVKENMELPNGLTYDTFSRQLCWADAGTHKMECVNPYTRQRKMVVEGITYPFSMVYYGRNLYYTDWRREAVVSVDHVAKREADEFLPQKRSRLYGITTVLAQCPQEVNHCASNNGGCPHLCLPRPGGFICRCGDIQDASCTEERQ